MKRNLDTLMMMPDKRTPMTFGSTGKPLTAGMMAAEACISMYPDEDPKPTAHEKHMRFKLSLTAELGGVQNFNQQELDVILRACHQKCGTWLYGQMAAWAEGVNPWGAMVLGNEDEETGVAVTGEEVTEAAGVEEHAEEAAE